MSEAITARAAASVVLIDDSDAIRSALKLALEDAGYRVLDAATGAEIAVPLFLETGTRVKVDTRDGSYLGRVN